MLHTEVKDGRWFLEMEAPHPQVLPYFPQYSLESTTPGTIVDYSDSRNVTGHQQRAWLVDICKRGYKETGLIGIDLGSAGVMMPFCLSTDIIANGERPEYGGIMSGVQLRVDASNMYNLGSDSFGFIISNHIIEHLPCRRLQQEGAKVSLAAYRERIRTPEFKMKLSCPGDEVAEIFDRDWLRVVKPGGYVAGIFPDEAAALRGGSSVFHQDLTHQHAWTADQFMENVLKKLQTPVEVIEFDTLRNNFSINFRLMKL